MATRNEKAFEVRNLLSGPNAKEARLCIQHFYQDARFLEYAGTHRSGRAIPWQPPMQLFDIARPYSYYRRGPRLAPKNQAERLLFELAQNYPRRGRGLPGLPVVLPQEIALERPARSQGDVAGACLADFGPLRKGIR